MMRTLWIRFNRWLDKQEARQVDVAALEQRSSQLPPVPSLSKYMKDFAEINNLKLPKPDAETSDSSLSKQLIENGYSQSKAVINLSNQRFIEFAKHNDLKVPESFLDNPEQAS